MDLTKAKQMIKRGLPVQWTGQKTVFLDNEIDVHLKKRELEELVEIAKLYPSSFISISFSEEKAPRDDFLLKEALDNLFVMDPNVLIERERKVKNK